MLHHAPPQHCIRLIELTLVLAARGHFRATAEELAPEHGALARPESAGMALCPEVTMSQPASWPLHRHPLPHSVAVSPLQKCAGLPYHARPPTGVQGRCGAGAALRSAHALSHKCSFCWNVPHPPWSC